MLKVTIEQMSGSSVTALYTYADAHARMFAIRINGVRCGVIRHVGHVEVRRGRLSRGAWIAEVAGRRIAQHPMRRAINGETRRALDSLDGLKVVAEAVAESADRELLRGNDEVFEERARLARELAAEIRERAEAEALA